MARRWSEIERDRARLRLVQNVLGGETSAETAARQLAPTSGLASKSTTGRVGAFARVLRDLSKLRATYNGKDDNRPGGAELKSLLQDIFGMPGRPKDLMIRPLTRIGDNGTIHGEAALIASDIRGAIGVSKLSCGDCADYALEKGRAIRGSHGMRFPGWEHPGTGRIPAFDLSDRQAANQYPTDSDSDGEG